MTQNTDQIRVQPGKGWTFAMVPFNVVCDAGLSDGAFRMFTYLAYRQGRHGASYARIARMARDLGTSRDTITRRIGELEDAGYLTVCRKPGLVPYYTLHATTHPIYPDDPPQNCTTPPPQPCGAMNERTMNEISCANAQGDDPPPAPVPLPVPVEAALPPTSSGLAPDTEAAQETFRRLRVNAAALHRRGPARFPTLEAKAKFDAVAAELGGGFPEALSIALAQGITAIPRLTSWLVGYARRQDQPARPTEPGVLPPDPPTPRQTPWGVIGMTVERFIEAFPSGRQEVERWQGQAASLTT